VITLRKKTHRALALGVALTATALTLSACSTSADNAGGGTESSDPSSLVLALVPSQDQGDRRALFSVQKAVEGKRSLPSFW